MLLASRLASQRHQFSLVHHMLPKFGSLAVVKLTQESECPTGGIPLAWLNEDIIVGNVRKIFIVGGHRGPKRRGFGVAHTKLLADLLDEWRKRPVVAPCDLRKKVVHNLQVEPPC